MLIVEVPMSGLSRCRDHKAIHQPATQQTCVAHAQHGNKIKAEDQPLQGTVLLFQ